MNQNHDKAIFIVGALNRSGTNFLSDIIQLDSNVEASKSIGEDYFLVYSDLLEQYGIKTTQHWGQTWRDHTNEICDEMMECFGTTLLDLCLKKAQTKKRVVFKTPRTNNLKNFWKLFPNYKVILLVRDGYDTVDSFLKSFKYYGFEQTVKLWVEGVKNINTFISDSENANMEANVLLLKYEDLAAGDPNVLQKLCNFCGLSTDMITPATVCNMPLRGSSVIRGESKDVHWGLVPKPSNYSPHNKVINWGRWKKWRFKRLAHKTMAKLEYRIRQNAK